MNRDYGNGDKKKFFSSKGRLVYWIIAKVDIMPMKYHLGKHKDFICFCVKLTNSHRHGIREFRIYDHRPETIRAATLPVSNGGDLYCLEGLQGVAARKERMRRKSVIKVANSTPAKVVVVEQNEPTGRTYHFINLFHAEGEPPTGLFSVRSCTKRRGSGVKADSSFWSKTLTLLRHGAGSVLVSLTDEEHQVIINGPRSREITIIGRSVRVERRENVLPLIPDSDGMASIEKAYAVDLED